jgi:hypothetical protein
METQERSYRGSGLIVQRIRKSSTRNTYPGFQKKQTQFVPKNKPFFTYILSSGLEMTAHGHRLLLQTVDVNEMTLQVKDPVHSQLYQR